MNFLFCLIVAAAVVALAICEWARRTHVFVANEDWSLDVPSDEANRPVTPMTIREVSYRCPESSRHSAYWEIPSVN